MTKTTKNKLFFYSILILTLYCFINKTSYNINDIIKNGPIIYDSNNDNLKRLIIATIKHSQHDLNLNIYSLNDTDILSLLQQKASNNINMLIKAGLPIKHLDINKLTPNIKYSDRNTHKKDMHKKTLISDDQLLLIGSSNYTYESLYNQMNLMVALYSKELCSVAKNNTHGKDIIRGQEILLYSLPYSSSKFIEDIIFMINSSKDSIKIAMYAFSYSKILDAINDAILRGISVEIIIDKTFVKLLSSVIKNNHKRIPFSLIKGSRTLHHKFAIIDNKILILGSANWTNQGLSKKEESVLIIPNMNKTQKQKMKSVWNELSSLKINYEN